MVLRELTFNFSPSQVLSGNITEVRFAWPNNKINGAKDVEQTSPSEMDYQEMQVIGETELSTNDVTYINGEFNFNY